MLLENQKTTQLEILNNKNILEIVNIFTDDYSVFKRGTKQEDKKPNILSTNEQLALIEAIIGNTFNISKEGKDFFLLHIGNGDVKYVEKNIKNFISILRVEFPNLLTHDDFENIKISELFEHLKSRKSYEFREYRSPFFKLSEFVIDEKHNSIISHIKIDFKHDLDKITQEIYQEITGAIHNHWLGVIPEILNYLVASKYAVDKKNLWLLIMADSNFGKSKIFEWMREWDGSAFINFEDIINTGINNKKPEDYYNKICLVIDEVMGFDRKLFKIENTLEIRPMRAHTVYIPINARILLSADGGKFNDEYMDKQIINRVSLIDFRGRNNNDLGDLEVTKKYGKNNIKRVMSHHLHTEIVKLIDFYESLDKNSRADEAERIINNFSTKHKMQKMDFFQMVELSIHEILKDFKGSLGSKFYEDIEDFIVEDFTYRKVKGVIMKSPASILERVLVRYNKTLQYELQFKKVPQMAEKINGWHYGSFEVEGKIIKGLFIPYKTEIIIQKNDGTIIDMTTGKELF